MTRGINAFTNLPAPLKIGLLAVSGGGILAGLVHLLSPGVFWVILIGLAVVVLLLVSYWRLLIWLNKRKVAPMERDLLKSTAATPQGISDPANVARLDDLRKKFAEGVRKFQTAGKSLYGFPWYVIVGEPGSGKTEAIRHCNVGFPPGLQDEFQGTGGTINMNWWFTDHAVILDTAGRLMFEAVETGGSKEWKEFLSLMRKYRPRCPINGLLLVIPADSLIKDTADQIEQKASKIARQFDVIQRTLDVRFPVFVVVTKSDLINGFRDFFDDLQDPQLQHQILGWSNPAPLDEPFDTEFVDQQVKAIQGRLFRRRLALLHQVVSEDRGTDKTRTADALYAFPQSLAKIAPRMARYLELIFSVGSQWSCKPLFFRGIYFTSSMREGSALDEDLAESLGVPIDSLPDGRVWERDRAYFLRDLFVRKIFREQGLVTHATNANRLHRRRKAAVLISAAVSVVLLLFFTFYAANRFNGSIGEIKDSFGGLAALMPEGDPSEAGNQLRTIMEVGEGSYRYVGRNGVPGMSDDVTRANLSSRLAGAVDRWNRKGVPWIFAPAAKLARRITPEKLNEAQAVLYELAVLQPFTQAARDMMSTQEQGDWTYQNPATRALHQLIEIRAQKPLNAEGDYSAGTFLEPFFEYVFRYEEDTEEEEDFQKRMRVYAEDKAELHRPLATIYNGNWPPAALGSSQDAPDPGIERGVRLFNEYWTDPNRLSARSQDYAQVKMIEELGAALEDVNDAEQSILSLQARFPGEPDKPYTAEQLDEFARGWQSGFTRLKKARDTVDRYTRTLETGATLEALWTKAANTAMQEIDKNYEFLLSGLKEAELKDFLRGVRDTLEATHRQIRERLSRGEFAQRLTRLDQRFCAELRGKGRLYDIRFEMYSRADNHLGEIGGTYALSEVAPAIQNIEKTVADSRQEVSNLLTLDPTAFRFRETSALSGLALTLAERRHLYHILKDGLEAAPKSAEELEKLIESAATWDWKGIPTETINRKYDPQAGGAVVAGWRSLGDTLKKYELPEEKDLGKVYEDANGIYTDYVRRCLDDYWLGRVPEDAIRARVSRDSQRFRDLIVREVFDDLDDLGKSLEKALAQFGGPVPQGSERVKQFRASLEGIRERYKAERIYSTSRSVLAKWRGLSGDVWATRRTLLEMPPADFREDYTPFSYRFHAELADAYWAELTYSLLRQLGAQAQDEGHQAFRELKTSYGGKFPLERDSQTDLTPEELARTVSLLSGVRPQEKFNANTIGAGAKTGLDQVDPLLAQLRGIQMSPTDSDWFERVERTFEALPRAHEPYYCRITLLGAAEQDRLVRADEQLLLPFFRKFRLLQGTDTSKQLRTSSPTDVPVDDLIVKYPGPPVRVEFYKLASDAEPNTGVTFSEPWACLRMLRQCHDGRKSGCVRLDVKGEEGQGGVLYLLLEFFADNQCSHKVDMPTPDQWPSLKQ
jgi:hypothetical protein